MGKKYIFELLDECNSKFKGIMVFGLTQEKQISVQLIPEESLTPYTEPDIEQVRKEAYEQGRKYGKVEGRAETWACVKKIAFNPESVECVDDLVRMGFDVGDGNGWSEAIEELFEKYSASEAIEKIRQYEQEKEEQIHVGDEVKNTQTDARFIVTHMWVNNSGEKGVSGFNYECSAFSTALDLIRKTGRHFPEIAEVLEKMREGQEQ